MVAASIFAAESAPAATIPAAVPAPTVTASLAPVIHFLTAARGKAAIVDDTQEPGAYFGQLQEMEMSAKTGRTITGGTLAEQRRECRARYQAGVLEFSPQEQVAIQHYIGSIYPTIVRNYPGFAAMPWSFIKVADNIEGGLPHTRGMHIVLSLNMCQQMLMLQKIPQAAAAMAELLVHEQMHVFQRANSARFDTLYTGLWGFVKAKSVTGCPWLDKHHLANPDGTDCCWVFPTKQGNGNVSYIWPLVVFAEGDSLKHMPQDFQMLAVTVEKNGDTFFVKPGGGGRPAAHDLTADTAYCAMFGGSDNIYHPHEASADLFAKLLMLDQFMEKNSLPENSRQRIEKTFAPLRKWFRENLAR